MFHHRFVKQKEALGFSLFFNLSVCGRFSFCLFLYRFTVLQRLSLCLFSCCFIVLQRLFLCLFFCCFIFLQRLFPCLFLIASPLFRGFLLPLFLSFHRSSEAFICSSFFVYFIYERLVVVWQQGEPIVAACLKSNMGGAQEGGFRHGHLFDLGNVDDQWARQATFVYVEDAFVGYDVCGVDGAFNGDQGCHGKACADDGPCACVLPEASKGTDGMQRYGGDVLQGYTAMECSVHIVLKWQSSCQLVKLST